MQLEFIQYVQGFNAPIIKNLFLFLAYFDRSEFYFALVPAVWLSLGFKKGFKFFLAIAIGMVLIQFIKAYFAVHRPFIIDPSVALIKVKGFSFPSGAAETSILISSILVKEWKSALKWPVAIIYTLLVSFSRVYLGVHYPVDILVGWVVGLLVFLIYLYAFPYFEKKLSRFKRNHLLIANAIFFTLLIFITPSSAFLPTGVAFIGLSIGICLCYKTNKFPLAINPKIYRLVNVALGIIGAFGIYFLTRSTLPRHNYFVEVITYLVIAVWVSFGSTAVSLKILPISGNKQKKAK